MNKAEQVGNIICFLLLIFEESDCLFKQLMNIHPDYLIEKFNRFIETEEIAHPWGLHPLLKSHRFDVYFEKYKDAFKT